MSRGSSARETLTLGIENSEAVSVYMEELCDTQRKVTFLDQDHKLKRSQGFKLIIDCLLTSFDIDRCTSIHAIHRKMK